MENLWNSTLQFVTEWSFAIMAILALVCFVAFLLTLIWAKSRIKYWHDYLCDEEMYHDKQYDEWQKSSENYQKQIQLWHDCQTKVEKEHKEELKKSAENSLKTINELLDKMILYRNKTIELEEKIKIAENRTACAEGKLRKFNTKKLAMDYAVEVFSLNDMEENLKETFDVIYDCLKEK